MTSGTLWKPILKLHIPPLHPLRNFPGMFFILTGWRISDFSSECMDGFSMKIGIIMWSPNFSKSPRRLWKPTLKRGKRSIDSQWIFFLLKTMGTFPGNLHLQIFSPYNFFLEHGHLKVHRQNSHTRENVGASGLGMHLCAHGPTFWHLPGKKCFP